ncbi:hypothetical protein FQR65_LT13701, partial [Abscondita terminalis]
MLYMCSVIADIETKGLEKFVTFVKIIYHYVFTYVTFSFWKGFLLWIVNVMCTITWNYMDLFIILISVAVAQKFRAVNHQLRLGIASKSKDYLFWSKLRENYLAVTKLCQTVDDAVSDIIFISFFNNLFVILVQLFNSLKPRSDGIFGRIYFIYSFVFLISRTMAVLLYASSVSEESRDAANVLMSTPSEMYNIVIEKLLYKIQVDPPTLTGKRFFNVTRALILN